MTTNDNSIRSQLCGALRSRWYLEKTEIDAILADREFFQPYLSDALAKRAGIGCVPESPIDATDGAAIFLLTQFHDDAVVPHLLTCLRMEEKNLDLLYSDTLTEHMWLPFAKLGSIYLDDLDMWGGMATADDVKEAFQTGPRGDFISGRAHDVYAVNRRWKRCAEDWEKSKHRKEVAPDELVEDRLGEPFDTERGDSPAIKIGRNEPCPCGSGKKYKKCHGA